MVNFWNKAPSEGEAMQLKMDMTSIEWRFWTATLVLIIAAVAGWTPGYGLVMLVSALQAVVFAIRTGSAMSFPSQVRIAYFAYTLLGLWEAGRVYCYAVLIPGTAMVVLFDRCGIALVLKLMPGNKGMVNPQCTLPGAQGRGAVRSN
jgi:hypothetical protein